MAKTRTSKLGASETAKPAKGAAARPSAGRVKGRSAAKRGPAAAKAAQAAPAAEAPPKIAKKKAPAPAERVRVNLDATASAPAAPTPREPASPPGQDAPPPAPDVDALAHNIARAIEQGGKVMAAYLLPRQSGEIKSTMAEDIGEMVRSIGRVAE